MLRSLSSRCCVSDYLSALRPAMPGYADLTCHFHCLLCKSATLASTFSPSFPDHTFNFAARTIPLLTLAIPAGI